MELHERIAMVRKAAGLSQEQLGERLGVTRQAVSKWESGQTVPDAATVARLCTALNVSADFVLLGREPGESGERQTQMEPVTCPCCGRRSPASITVVCPGCGYDFYPQEADGEERYAILITGADWMDSSRRELVKFSGMTAEQAKTVIDELHVSITAGPFLLRRGLSKSAALWMASQLRRSFGVRIVPDDSAYTDSELCDFPTALELPDEAPPFPGEEERHGLGFGGTVAAVVVGIIAAVVILSFL